MQTIYRLNTEELTVTFVESLKSLLPNQEIEIVVSTLPKTNDIDSKDWLRSATFTHSFDFLRDEAENIYSVNDGVRLEDEK